MSRRGLSDVHASGVHDGDASPRAPGHLLAARENDPLHQESERLFRSLVENAPDALLISDQGGVILFSNPVADALFGYGPGELQGLSIDVLVPSRLRASHGERREGYLRAPSTRPMGALRELWAQRKDGSEIPVEISLSPVRTDSGVLVTSIIRDVSGRRRIEEMMRLQGVALGATANGVVITDRAGNITWANPSFCRMVGWEEGEIVGKSTKLFRSGRHDDAFYQELWETILGGKTWRGEIINRRRDGSLYVEEQTITPVPDARGEITHFIAIKADITERKQAQAELHRMNEVLRSELQEAATFVRSVLPRPMTFQGVGLDWVFQPSAELGGDGLGYHVRPDGTLALYLLDVCGHGLAAALLSVAVLTSLRSGRIQGVSGANPAGVLASLNQAFPASEHSGLFFTLWYGIFDPETRQLRHASAGAPQPILIEPGQRSVELGEVGTMIGVDPGASWVASEHSLAPGSQLFVFSDGAYELATPGGSLLPYERFVEAVEGAATAPRPPEELASFARSVCAPGLPGDDLSVLLLRVPLLARRSSSSSLRSVKP